MVYIEKSCRNCRDNENCCLYDKIDFDLELEVECKLEEGILHEAVQESINLKPVFQRLQDDGVIKKNLKIKEIDDDYIMQTLTEQIADGIWKFIQKQIGSIKPEQSKMTDTEFYCSEWR